MTADLTLLQRVLQQELEAGCADATVEGGLDELLLSQAHGEPAGSALLRMVGALPIPANATVALAPGGTHIMLDGMKEPLAVGDRIELTLRFEKAGTKAVSVNVNAPAAR